MVRLVFAIAAALFLAAPARAQDSGFYAGVDAGYHMPDRIDTTVRGANEQWSWGAGNDMAEFARFGYAFGSGFRAELELGYRPSDLKSITAGVFLPLAAQPLLRPFGGVHFFDVAGHVDTTTVMASGYYDIPLDLPVHPFVGGGIGLVHTSVAGTGSYPYCPVCAVALPICFFSCTTHVPVGGGSDAFGVQAAGGLDWRVAPDWTLEIGYRYLHAGGVGWDTQSAIYFPGAHHSGDYSDNTVTVGVRYWLGDLI
jgi:opacity protein-like surface antigen